MREPITFMTEQELCNELERQNLFEQYLKMRQYERSLFTEFCTGQSMTLLTYDSIFKFIFQSDGNYQRLEHFLTAVLGFEVQVEKMLPLEGTKMIRSGSVLYLDVLAKTKDGSLINVEMQKYPYKFSGERESCYQADMIMRQYNLRINEAKQEGRKFQYGDMCPVYTIILLEKSYYGFLRMNDKWKHTGEIRFNTGIKLNYLPHIIYITLDNFRNIEENIDTEQKRWVYLFSADTPERISSAAAMSEEFFGIIRDTAAFCRDVGEVFAMFSEALREMDKNMEELMYAEAMEELSETKVKLSETEGKLSETEGKLSETEGKLSETEEKLGETEGKLSETEEKLSETEGKLFLMQKVCRLAMQGKSVVEIAEECQISEEEVERLK